MRNFKNELDVDFIGGQMPLTKEEENAVSQFIKASQLKREKAKARKIRTRPAKQTVVRQ